ncbi:hypothetical protein LSH36_58g22017, partial [Paralvinella palmiformis]
NSSGYDRCYLVGHDFGGAVAWTFAAKHPEMVRKLICCNMPNPFAMRAYIRLGKSFFILFKLDTQCARANAHTEYIFMFRLAWLPEWFLSVRALDLLSAAFRQFMTE